MRLKIDSRGGIVYWRVVKIAVEPFFFGAEQPNRFGCYHTPCTDNPTGTVIVLCYPFGHEYIRAHRSYRLLATRLAQMGRPVLRFDFSGCGDSGGGLESVSIRQWLDDVSAAIDAATARTGLERVCLVGARLGAALVAMTAAGHRGIAEMVLWDPIVSGTEYVAELQRAHARMLTGAHVIECDSPAGGGSDEWLGFSVPHTLTLEIASLDLLQLSSASSERALIVDSRKDSCSDRLKKHLESLGVDTAFQQTSERQPWIWVEDVAQVEVPVATLDVIVSWICSRPQ